MRSMKVSMSGNKEKSKMICVKIMKNNPSQPTFVHSIRARSIHMTAVDTYLCAQSKRDPALDSESAHPTIE